MGCQLRYWKPSFAVVRTLCVLLLKTDTAQDVLDIEKEDPAYRKSLWS